MDLLRWVNVSGLLLLVGCPPQQAPTLESRGDPPDGANSEQPGPAAGKRGVENAAKPVPRPALAGDGDDEGAPGVDEPASVDAGVDDEGAPDE